MSRDRRTGGPTPAPINEAATAGYGAPCRSVTSERRTGSHPTEPLPTGTANGRYGGQILLLEPNGVDPLKAARDRPTARNRTWYAVLSVAFVEHLPVNSFAAARSTARHDLPENGNPRQLLLTRVVG